MQLHLAGLDLRQIEDVVDQRQQVTAALSDEFHIFAILGRLERTECAVEDQLREAVDGVQRRAQLVRHVGEELRLAEVGHVGGAARRLQLLGQQHQFAGPGFEIELGVLQLGLALLLGGDVGADGDIAAAAGRMMADHQPALACQLAFADEGLAAGEARQPDLDERIDCLRTLDARIFAMLRAIAQHVFQLRTGLRQVARDRIELGEAAVGDDAAQIGIEQAQSLR